MNRGGRGLGAILIVELVVVAALVVLAGFAYRDYQNSLGALQLPVTLAAPGEGAALPLPTPTADLIYPGEHAGPPLQTPLQGATQPLQGAALPLPTLTQLPVVAPPTPTPAPSATLLPVPALPPEPVIYAVGDIAECTTNPGALTVTSALLDERPEGLILALGDLSNDSGSAADYATCFDPAWGRHLPRMRAVPGNHEYDQPGAADYFAYAGAVAGPAGLGYYSFDFQGWHIVALNSNCDQVGGCDPNSPQYQWLEADLAAHPAACTLAFWHHPLQSSGKQGGTEAVRWFWQALYASGADVILNGHDHHYERYAPLNVVGGYDPEQGLRQFIVGTGGAGLWGWREPGPQVSGRVIDYGVLRLALTESGYAWQFIAADGSIADYGEAECH